MDKESKWYISSPGLRNKLPQTATNLYTNKVTF